MLNDWVGIVIITESRRKEQREAKEGKTKEKDKSEGLSLCQSVSPIVQE
jgi:hypothetical protein